MKQEFSINDPLYKQMVEQHLPYSFDYLYIPMKDKFILISLIAFLLNKAKIKAPDATALPVILKVLGEGIDNFDKDYIYALAIVVDDFVRNTDVFDSCGLSSVEHIMEQIRVYLNRYLPFGKDLPF